MGCGLSIAPGWINVDGSLNAFLAKWPKIAHRWFYRLSGSSQYYAFEEYHKLLSTNRFVFHNLEYGLPFADQCADAIYSSHFIEHLTKQDSAHLLAEAFRVLKPGGLVRIGVPNLAFVVSLYKLEAERMLDNYFFVEHHGSYFARHKYMYDYDLLKSLLERIGFTNVSQCGFRQGRLPNVELLDNRPEDSLYVEATRSF
jgi:SAM-dependent methyltransferase